MLHRDSLETGKIFKKFNGLPLLVIDVAYPLKYALAVPAVAHFSGYFNM